MKLIALLLTLVTSIANAAPVIITTTGEAPAGLVTEEEYAAREAARPPATPSVDVGIKVVKTEAELTAALLVGGKIVVPGINLVLSKRFNTTVPGTVLSGNGAYNSKITLSETSTDDYLYRPLAPDCTIQDITLSGGKKRAMVINMDGHSRPADRHTIQRVNFESCSFGIYLSGGPAVTSPEFLEDFQVLQFRITDFDQYGIYMGWEILRPRFQDFYICGKGSDPATGSAGNGIWIGLGVVDGYVINGVIEKVGRIGLEAYYPQGTYGGPDTALISKTYPYGPGMTFDNLVVSNTGSMGISLAGCKRSNIGKLTVRDSYFIGVEFVDEDPTRSDYNVTGPVNVSNHIGYGISIDKIKGGQFSGIQVDTMKPLDVYQYGMQVYYSDDVTFHGSTFTNCGPRYIQTINSTRSNFIDNHFVSKPGETWPDPEGGNFAFYIYGGDAYFHSNLIRGNDTNPLRTGLNSSTVSTSPTAVPMTVYNPDWQDGDNYRGRQFTAAKSGPVVAKPEAANRDLAAEFLAFKKKYSPKPFSLK